MRFFITLIMLTSALMAAGEVPPGATAGVYPLFQADPGSTETAVRDLIGTSGTVVLDAKHHRLLVLATPSKHAQIKSLMDQLSLPARNVRIDVTFISQGRQKESGAGLQGHGDVIVTEKGVYGSLRIRPEIHNTLTEQSSNVKQTLLVGSGRQGTLMVGTEKPILEWALEYGRQWGYIQGHVQWHQVGARLLVQPTVLGDGQNIHLRVVPELSGEVDGQTLRTEFARAATEITVPNGSTVTLGGLQKDNAFYSRFLLGYSQSGVQEHLDIEITPHIMPLPTP